MINVRTTLPNWDASPIVCLLPVKVPNPRISEKEGRACNYTGFFFDKA